MAEKTIAGLSGTAPAGKEDDIKDLFTHLELNEDELDDVVIGVEEAKVYQEAGRWLAIGKIHGIPELYRKMEVMDDLARKVGKVKEVQLAPKLFFEGNYVRIRVRINIAKALMRFVTLTMPEGKKRLMIKYEKVPFFCKRCGFMGHDHEECGDGVWEEKQLQFGAWMLATRRANQPAPAPRRFTSTGPFRGGFSGRGGLQAGSTRKRSSEDASLDTESDLGDTGSSPLKAAPMECGMEVGGLEKDTVIGASRKLDMNTSAEASMDEAIGDQSSINTHVEAAPPPPLAYVDPRDQAKLRKTEDNQNNLATSAASDEEDRHAQ
ncbi:hypothetical protein ACQ4PT_019059 [Festuca glaucescens]